MDSNETREGLNGSFFSPPERKTNPLETQKWGKKKKSGEALDVDAEGEESTCALSATGGASRGGTRGKRDL